MNVLIGSIYHKQSPYIKCEWIKPLAVGGFNGGDDFLSDNTGDNISDLNFTYAELTGLYWMWKNTSADFMGLCHYRRYFNFSRTRNIGLNNLCSDQQKSSLVNILEDFDVVLPYAYSLGSSIEAQYKVCHVPSHYDIFIEEVKTLYPSKVDNINAMSNNNFFRSNNCFVAKQNVWNHYCSDLFYILEKVRNRIDVNIDAPDKRHIGYLGERFLNIFFEIHGYKIWCSEVVMI